MLGEGAEHDTRGRVCSPYHSNSKHIPPAGERDGVAEFMDRLRLSLDRRVHLALVCQVFRKRERDDAAAGRTTRFRSPGGIAIETETILQ